MKSYLPAIESNTYSVTGGSTCFQVTPAGTCTSNGGKSVSISGDYVIVGAYYEDDIGTDRGAAYFFK